MILQALTQTILGFPAWVFWVFILVLALILEMATVNMTTIWFALGAFAALTCTLFRLDLVWQVIAFFVFSLIGIAIFVGVVKPRLSKRSRRDRATNADRILDREGIVIVRIDPLAATGQIQVIGQIWSARSADESTIEVGAIVRVVGLESVYAIVQKVN